MESLAAIILSFLVSTSDAAELLDQAKAHIEKSENKPALELLEEAFKATDDTDELREIAALIVATSTLKYPNRESYLKYLVKFNVTHPQLCNWLKELGDRSFNRKQYDEAEDWYLRASQHCSPTEAIGAEVHLKLGDVAKKLGRTVGEKNSDDKSSASPVPAPTLISTPETTIEFTPKQAIKSKKKQPKEVAEALPTDVIETPAPKVTETPAPTPAPTPSAHPSPAPVQDGEALPVDSPTVSFEDFLKTKKLEPDERPVVDYFKLLNRRINTTLPKTYSRSFVIAFEAWKSDVEQAVSVLKNSPDSIRVPAEADFIRLARGNLEMMAAQLNQAPLDPEMSEIKDTFSETKKELLAEIALRRDQLSVINP